MSTGVHLEDGYQAPFWGAKKRYAVPKHYDSLHGLGCVAWVE